MPHLSARSCLPLQCCVQILPCATFRDVQRLRFSVEALPKSQRTRSASQPQKQHTNITRRGNTASWARERRSRPMPDSIAPLPLHASEVASICAVSKTTTCEAPHFDISLGIACQQSCCVSPLATDGWSVSVPRKPRDGCLALLVKTRILVRSLTEPSTECFLCLRMVGNSIHGWTLQESLWALALLPMRGFTNRSEARRPCSLQGSDQNWGYSTLQTDRKVAVILGLIRSISVECL